MAVYYCEKCEVPLAEQMMWVRKTEVKTGNLFCPQCDLIFVMEEYKFLPNEKFKTDSLEKPKEKCEACERLKTYTPPQNIIEADMIYCLNQYHACEKKGE